MILSAGTNAQSRRVAGGLVFRCTLAAACRTRWAWLADTHIGGLEVAARDGWLPDSQLAGLVRQVRAARPHGLVVNGDLALRDGLPRDYLRLRTLLHPLNGVPTVVAVGNHDRRGPLLAALGGVRVAEPSWLAAVVDQPPYRFVVLDSQADPESVGGEIGAGQLEWLEGLLARSAGMRAIIFLHHPGESLSEGCRDFGSLIRLAARSASAQAIVTGHDHAFTVGKLDSVHLIGLPSTAFPFLPGGDCGWVEAALSEDALQVRFRGTRSSTRHLLRWRTPRGPG